MPDSDKHTVFMVLVTINAEDCLYFGYGLPKRDNFVVFPISADEELLMDIFLDKNSAVHSTMDFLPEFDPFGQLFDPPVNGRAPKEWLADMGELKLVSRQLIGPSETMDYMKRISAIKIVEACDRRKQALLAQSQSQEVYEQITWLGAARSGLRMALEDQKRSEQQGTTLEAMRRHLEDQ